MEVGVVLAEGETTLLREVLAGIVTLGQGVPIVVDKVVSMEAAVADILRMLPFQEEMVATVL
jgi:hypothetical protein